MARDRKKGSSTPGKQKGANCHKSVLKNLYSKDTRAYRTKPNEWLAAVQEVQNVLNAKGATTKLQELVNKE